MPDNEFDSLQCAHYPRVAEVLYKWKEHEDPLRPVGIGNGWRAAFIFDNEADAAA